MRDLDLLRTLAPPGPPPSTHAYARGRERLHARIEAETRRWPVRPRRFLPALSLAAGAAAAAAVFLSIGTGGEDAASAAATLRRAAAVARAQAPFERLGPEQYLYTNSVDAYLSSTSVSEVGQFSFSVLIPHTREIWLARDGTGWLVQTSGAPVFLSDRDRAAWVEAGRPKLDGGSKDVVLENTDGPNVPMYSLDLPSDPDVLYDRLKRDAGDWGNRLNDEMFMLVGDALRENYATPERRAALFEVAARIPGVELVGPVTDRRGRPGVAVARSMEATGIRHTLIFDPQTSQLLAEEDVTLDNNWAGYPEGTVIGYATFVASAVVDEIKERPRD